MCKAQGSARLSKASARSTDGAASEVMSSPGVRKQALIQKGDFSMVSQRLPAWVRAAIRLMACVANTLMLVFIYGDHIFNKEYAKFSHFLGLDVSQDMPTGAPAGISPRLVEQLWHGQFDVAFDCLGALTFSESMLSHLDLYVMVGLPVAIIYILCERDRVRWLQGLIAQHQLDDKRDDAIWRLECYLWCLATCFVFVVGLYPFPLTLPLAHYLVAAGAFAFGSCSIYLYVSLPVDWEGIANGAQAMLGQEGGFQSWAWRQRYVVRPVLLSILALHLVTLGIGMLKVEDLYHNSYAVLFGVFETLVVLAYQLFVGCYMVDDVMMSFSLPAKGVPLIRKARSVRVAFPSKR
jgi:hypothetical protein